MIFFAYISGILVTLYLVFIMFSNDNNDFKNIINNNKNIAFIFIVCMPMLSWVGLIILITYQKQIDIT